MSHLCPSESELSRMFHGDLDAPLPASIALCEACRARWQQLVRAVRIARALPVDLPSSARRDEVRAELLARATASPWPPVRRPLARVVGPAVAAVVIMGGLALFRTAGRSRPPRSHVTVHAQPATRYEVASAPPDETLRLHDGTINLDVEPLGAHGSFRVLVGDDEIVVRGTSFAVTAASDHLMAVAVTRGRVDVRPRRGVEALLGPGQSWTPAPVEVVAPFSQPAIAPALDNERHRPARASLPRAEWQTGPPPPGARLRPSTEQTVAEESAYNDAWNALRASDFRRAAAGFGRVIALAPAGALADEAAFWRAVAIARDGSPRRAIVAFQQMLAAYPASPRRGEAAVILGWLLVDAHQLDEAAALFRSAANDPAEVVRASARRGLAPPPRAPERGGVSGQL